jgi:hypothetical protein
MVESTFHIDLKAEQLLQPYLDSCYRANGYQVTRCSTVKEQRAGIDVRLARDGMELLIDEKAQTHYIGRSLPTCALEIEFYRDNERRTGWLYDSRKRTDAYSFVFDVSLSDSSTELVTSDAVTNAHVLLVDRKRLRMALMHDGLFETGVRGRAEHLRMSSSTYCWLGSTGHKLVLSNHLAERPINLVVRRTFLEHLGQSLVPSP